MYMYDYVFRGARIEGLGFRGVGLLLASQVAGETAGAADSGSGEGWSGTVM